MKDWLALQQKLLKRVKIELKSQLKKSSPSLRRYESQFQRDQKTLKPSSWIELEQAINQSDVVCIGDFHPLRQSQRFLLRLLRNARLKKPKAMGLEVLSKDHYPLLHTWLKRPSRRHEQKLKEALRLEEIWGSDFNTYKDLFLTAHQMGLQLVALGFKDHSLLQRDQKIAAEILRAPAPVWCLLGAFHVARPHVPHQILRRSPTIRLVSLQQDDETLSQTPHRQRVYADPRKSGAKLFCVQHSPAWLKWQSLWMHLEREERVESAEDQIRWCLETLQQFFEDPRYPKAISPAALKEVSVVHLEEEGSEKTLQKMPAPKRRRVLKQIELLGSGVCLSSHRIFVVEETINAYAHAAANYLLRQYWHRSEVDEVFLDFVLHECLCFFLSKILNHSRRSKHWIDFKQSPSTSQSQRVLKSRQFFAHYRDLEKWSKSLRPYRLETGVLLGRILADCLFEAFLAGEISKERINRMISEPPIHDEESFLRCVEILSVGRAFERKEKIDWRV
jgi:hypothetical protein